MCYIHWLPLNIVWCLQILTIYFSQTLCYIYCLFWFFWCFQILTINFPQILCYICCLSISFDVFKYRQFLFLRCIATYIASQYLQILTIFPLRYCATCIASNGFENWEFLCYFFFKILLFIYCLLRLFWCLQILTISFSLRYCATYIASQYLKIVTIFSKILCYIYCLLRPLSCLANQRTETIFCGGHRL